jgi:mannose-6-phosphate isomerase-like protein (cupin superfamily)
MRGIFASILVGSAVFASAAMAADDYVVMPKSTREFKLGAGGYARQQALVNHKNSQASVTIRDKDGQVEVHSGWEDHMFILAGEGKLVLGGTVEKPNVTGPGETRGESIKGGKTIVLHPEDYIFIPVNTPHQMLIAPGKTVRYTVVKTHP